MLRPYGLVFDGTWRLDRRSIKKAVTPRTRAIVVGNPADPTGATLSRDELGFLEELCSARGLVLVGNESFLDSALGPSATVARVTQCLAFHLSGLAGVCGLLGLEGHWLAAAGPDALVSPALSRLRSRTALTPQDSSPALLALPPLLARRERFLTALRARLARNRAALATASLREAPWTLQWGGGGWWAVLQISPVQDEDDLCIALLEDGVAVQPGYLDGLPREGYLAVSLLPEPKVFDHALQLLDAQLRRPL
jgi:aspartate/methionine/tyrosine aminotransferase